MITRRDLAIVILAAFCLATTLFMMQQTSVFAAKKSPGLPPPDYDSGWIRPIPGVRLRLMHNLGTTEVFVYIVARESTGRFVHQDGYGGITWGPDSSGWERLQGCSWVLSSSQFMIDRWPDDNSWTEARVRIWRIAEP